jgi:hypothetical protein
MKILSVRPKIHSFGMDLAKENLKYYQTIHPETYRNKEKNDVTGKYHSRLER